MRFSLSQMTMAAIAAAAMAATPALAQRFTPPSFDPDRPGVWKTNLEKKSVDFSEIFSGGVPRDGIPPIYDPLNVSIAEAEEFLDDTAPVISVKVNGEARAYPLGVLMRHEIVNDELGGEPIAATFCPLCNSAVTFNRRVDDQVLTFGVSGFLRNSDLIMWDHETESWWQQFLGESIVGDMTGTLLDIIPTRVEGFAVFKERFPDGTVNIGSDRFGGFNNAYLFNPYVGYDEGGAVNLFFGPDPEGIESRAYVVAVGDQAWTIDLLREQRRVEADDIVITWEPGQNAVMGAALIAENQDIGNVIVQRRTADGLVDVAHDTTFAFTFNAFHPEGTIHKLDGQ